MNLAHVVALFSRAVVAFFERLGDRLSRQKGALMEQVMLAVQNAGFEDGWREVNGVGELKVADHWFPWWHQSDARPEFKIASTSVDANRVRSGSAAQQWFNTYATHTGGVYQQVADVPVGKRLILTAFVQAFTRNDDADWRKSTGRYRMRIGLDPYGGTNPESQDVVWSEVIQPYDDWFPLSVESASHADRCTIFVWGQAEWAFKHNNAYVDDCQLVYEDDKDQPEPPPPQPDDLKTATRAIATFARKVARAANELANRMDRIGE
jgi:hypothetical protein